MRSLDDFSLEEMIEHLRDLGIPDALIPAVMDQISAAQAAWAAMPRPYSAQTYDAFVRVARMFEATINMVHQAQGCEAVEMAEKDLLACVATSLGWTGEQS